MKGALLFLHVSALELFFCPTPLSRQADNYSATEEIPRFLHSTEPERLLPCS
jgi:hypothetical protein